MKARGHIQRLFSIDLRSLALFRVSLALILLWDLAVRACSLTAHYSDWGIVPRTLVTGDYTGAFRWSLHLVGGGAWFEGLLFILAALAALCLLVGYRTRLAQLVSFLLLLSLQVRNPIILIGADELLRVLMFWGLFLPLGARYSVDAALNPEPATEPHHFSAAGAALLIQVMAVYFFTALLKSDPMWLPEGTAVYYALQLDQMATPFGVWLRQFDGLLQLLTYYVWFLEIFAFLLVFSPLFIRWTRGIAIVLLAIMHLGFALCLELGWFPFVSLASLSVFIGPTVWAKLEGFIKRDPKRRLKIYYDEPCTFCRKTCLLLRGFLLLPWVPIQAAQNDPDIHAILERHNSWVLEDHSGERHIRGEALAYLITRSPLFWWLGRLLQTAPMRRALEAYYGWVADHREALGRLTARLLPYRSQKLYHSRPTNILALALLCYTLAWNLSTLPQLDFKLSGWQTAPAQLLGLEQSWSMFAPRPHLSEGWYVIPGRLKDGAAVDVQHYRIGEPDWSKPVYLSQTYPDHRWHKFYRRVWRDEHSQLRLPWARYLCWQWNEDAPPDRQLQNFDIYFLRETSLPDYRRAEPERLHLWRHHCFEPIAPESPSASLP